MDPYIGEVVGGRYQLLHRLASGGMGAVYVGRGVGAGGFERRLAVKLLHPHLAEHEKFVAMFLDEARLAARIHHPNVVPTLDVFEEEGDHFLVMDYVDGLELGRLIHEALKQRQKLPAAVVLRIALDALAGLVAAHELKDKEGRPLNLVHRDISPQNILVGADGISRLTDFGVAKAANQIHVTQGAEFKGKLAYAAPEQIEKSVVEQRSDVFAIGIVVWEALAQRRLFKAEDKLEIRRMVLSGEYPTLSSTDPELGVFDDIIARAMQPDLERRTRSARLLADELEAAAASIATPGQVAKWVRAIGVQPLTEREEEIRVSESQVPYPSQSASSPSVGRSSGPVYTAPLMPGAETSEVVPAGAHPTHPTTAGTPASRRAGVPEDAWAGLPPPGGAPMDGSPTPAPVQAVPSGAVFPPPLDDPSMLSDGPTIQEMRRRMLPWILIACVVLAAAIGVATFLVTNDPDREPQSPVNGTGFRVISDPPSSEPAPPASRDVPEPPPEVEPPPDFEPTPMVAAPATSAEEEIEEVEGSTTESMRRPRMRAATTTEPTGTMEPEEDVPGNPYDNL